MDKVSVSMSLRQSSRRAKISSNCCVSRHTWIRKSIAPIALGLSSPAATGDNDNTSRLSLISAGGLLVDNDGGGGGGGSGSGDDEMELAIVGIMGCGAFLE